MVMHSLPVAQIVWTSKCTTSSHRSQSRSKVQRKKSQRTQSICSPSWRASSVPCAYLFQQHPTSSIRNMAATGAECEKSKSSTAPTNQRRKRCATLESSAALGRRFLYTIVDHYLVHTAVRGLRKVTVTSPGVSYSTQGRCLWRSLQCCCLWRSFLWCRRWCV